MDMASSSSFSCAAPGSLNSGMNMQAAESPRTPRGNSAPMSFTPMPLVPSYMKPEPAMLRALRSKSLEQVLRVLREDPETASEPFWDHDLKTPLGVAKRSGCVDEIVDVLIAHGADPEAWDVPGRTPRHRQQNADSPRSVNSEPIRGDGMDFLTDPLPVSMVGETIHSLVFPPPLPEGFNPLLPFYAQA